MNKLKHNGSFAKAPFDITFDFPSDSQHIRHKENWEKRDASVHRQISHLRFASTPFCVIK